ncbi:MAG: hypothetical protein AAF718_17110 [Pseudomonadota bacterium]
MTHTIPLFTSIPPTLNRKNSNGNEIGAAYQSICLDSWITSGFAPVSVNAAAEAGELGEDPRFEKRRLHRSAADVYGKPIVFLEDFLLAAAENPTQIVAITNADILLDFSADQQAALRNLGRNDCVVMKRRDIERPDQRHGAHYPYGYDFFAMPARALVDISCGLLAIGVPWWDHFLSLFLMHRGMHSVDIGDGVFHLSHNERWDEEAWINVGAVFDQILQVSLDAYNVEKNQRLAEYLREVCDALNGFGVPWFTRLERRFINGIIKRPPSRDPFFLRRVSHLNNARIDSWRGVDPRS